MRILCGEDNPRIHLKWSQFNLTEMVHESREMKKTWHEMEVATKFTTVLWHISYSWNDCPCDVSNERFLHRLVNALWKKLHCKQG